MSRATRIIRGRPSPVRSDVRAIAGDLVEALAFVRAAIKPADGTHAENMLIRVETFAAVALSVFAETPPALIRSKAMNVEIQFRMPADEVGA